MESTLMNKAEVDNFVSNWKEMKTKDYYDFVTKMELRIDFIFNEIFGTILGGAHNDELLLLWCWKFFGSNSEKPEFKVEMNIVQHGIDIFSCYDARFLDKFGNKTTIGGKNTIIPFRWLYEEGVKEEISQGEIALEKEEETEKKIRREKNKTKEVARIQRRIDDTNKIYSLILEKGISIEDCCEISRLLEDIQTKHAASVKA